MPTRLFRPAEQPHHQPGRPLTDYEVLQTLLSARGIQQDIRRQGAEARDIIVGETIFHFHGEDGVLQWTDKVHHRNSR